MGICRVYNAEMDVTLHIGLPKTGTTFLQKNFFPRLENVKYVHQTDPIYNLVDGLNHKSVKLILSSERFSGDPYKGNWLQQFVVNVHFLKNTFPQSRVVLGLRDHKELALSLYSQYLHQGGTLPINEFYGVKGMISPSDFSFKERISLLYDLFDRDKTFLYWQSSLLINSEEVIEGLTGFIESSLSKTTDFADKSHNKSVGKKNGELLRRFNQIDKALHNKKLPGLRNSLLQRLKLDSRTICQRYLKKLGEEKFELSSAFLHKLNLIIKEDERFLKRVSSND